MLAPFRMGVIASAVRIAVASSGVDAVLLAHFNGANTSTTLTDSSLFGRSIAAVGTAQISTAQAKFGGASLALDGSFGNYATAQTPALPGDFTVEAWVYDAAGSGDRSIITLPGNVQFYISYTGRLAFYSGTNSSEGSTAVGASTWHHVAMSRQGSTLRLFLNGILQSTITTYSASIASGTAYIGAIASGGSTFKGYIDELRIVRGSALYTTNFTPPSSPFADLGGHASKVIMHLHMDGANGSTAIADSSQYSVALAANGNAQISTAQSKFGGASALFDGSSGFIATSGSISSSNLSTDDFTIEFFVRFTALAPAILITKSSGTAAYPWQIFLDASNKIRARSVGVDGLSMVFDIASATTVTSGAWYHVALTRAGSSFRLFLNGALEASVSSASPLYNDTTTQIYIGAYSTGASPLNGNIDELRILKGLALYTAAFTPPGQAFADAPFKATKLLLHMDGVDGSTTFVDSSSAARVVTPFGDARIVTAQSKFGGASSRFDGNGDYLSIPSSVDFDLGSIYTVEFWIRVNDAGRQAGIIHRGKYSTIGTAWDGLAFSIRQLNNYLRCYFYATNGSTEQYIDTSSITLAVGQWHHVAMVRNGTAGQVFIDGVSAGTISGLNTPAASTYPVLIGDWQFDVSGTLTHQYFYGWLDEVRITKGQALYTANFTPPTQPFPDDPSSGVAFSYTGADQSYTVPAGVTSITVRAWGGGGGSNGASSSQTDRAFGGSGGFVRASVPVTPGETLTIKVGGGGARGTTTRQAANGGGRSEILRGSTPLVIAGAGGGAGGYGNGWVSSFGGLGGGLTGGAAEAGASSANPAATPGQGGTQSAGGAVGSPTGSGGTPATAGAAKQGGSGNYTGSLKPAAWPNGGRSSATEEERGGGGGDGYFGGGAGGGQGTWGNGGGGGSSYTDAACTGVMHAQGTNVSGTGPTAPGVTEDGYIAGVALGGLNSASGGVDGGPGLVVITPN